MIDNFLRCVREIYADIGTPVSLELEAKLVLGDWRGLLSYKIDPNRYDNPSMYLKDAQAVALLKKCAGLPTGIDTKAAAKETWYAGESSCKKANDRLECYLPGALLPELRDDRITKFLSDVKNLLASWIGWYPPELVEGRFGPGSTFADKGQPVVADKISSVPTLTRGAIYHLPQMLGSWWGHCVANHHGRLNFVRGNRYATALKNGLTDRSTGIEPSVNVFFQLGYGKTLRDRLHLRTGVDLTVAQLIHRELARRASIDRQKCTIDLSNASDTLCTNLVKLVLPDAWYDVLSSLRSPMTFIDGKWVKLEKFSSMGNGFTFELETLIFAAIACLTARRCGKSGVFGEDVFVFGDDIIVDDALYEPLKSGLAFFGFTVNDSKSFHGDSPFRESCGGDYLEGCDVRPFYQKRIPDEPQEIIGFYNGTRRFLKKSGIGYSDSFNYRCLDRIVDNLPSSLRSLWGPEHLGDLVLHTDNTDRYIIKRSAKCKQSRLIRIFKPDRVRVIPFSGFAPDAVLATALYGASGSSLIGGFTPRDGVLSYRLGWTGYLGPATLIK